MSAHGHSHSSRQSVERPSEAQVAARRRLRLVLTAVLVPLMLLTAVAAGLLFSERATLDLPGGFGPATGLVRADIEQRDVVPCATDGGELPFDVPVLDPSQTATSAVTECISAGLLLTSGPDAGTRFVLDVLSLPTRPFPVDGGVLLAFQPDADVGGQYVYVDAQRDQPLLLLGAVFAAAVLLLGRWAGLRALAGLATSLLVITVFVLPALLAGRNALLVAIVGSALVLFASMFLAHGVTMQTSIAVLGTVLSLLLMAVLAQVFVPASRLTGLEAGDASLLTGVVAGFDLRGLLLAGIVIGSLGVLDDVTATQAASVWELHLANPRLRARELYRAGMRIGRHHATATVNTLALAYVGASLPLFVVFSLVETQLRDALTREVVAQEIVRAVVGSLGLMAAIPVTTALAALVVGIDRSGSAEVAEGQGLRDHGAST